MNEVDFLLRKKEELLQKIKQLETELNEEKDNEDTWGGHDGPGYMELEHELLLRVEFLKEIEIKIKKSQ